MKKIVVLTLIGVMCFGIYAEAQQKKVAVVSRISWCPGGYDSTRDRDFSVMPHFSMDDVYLQNAMTEWGYFSIPMVSFALQYTLNGAEIPFPVGDDADYYDWVDDGTYLDQPTFLQDMGIDLAYVDGTLWSAIVPKLIDQPIPIIMANSSCLGTKNKLGSTGMFTQGNGDDYNGRTTIMLTDEGKVHPLTAGMPDTIVVFGDGPDGPPENEGHSWYGIADNADEAAMSTEILAVWADDESKAAIAVVEAGGNLASGIAQARLVMPFWSGQQRPATGDIPANWDAVFEHLTPDGVELTRRCVRWALGEDPAPVAKWVEF